MLDDKGAKIFVGNIFMEVFVFKSIFRSVVELFFMNSDVLFVRFKFFECRNYGDENYDKCIKIFDID